MFTRITIMAAVSATGCATKPDRIAPKYVSPTVYQHLTCDQMAQEYKRLEARRAQIIAEQKKNSDTDAAMTGIGAIIFWPALFALAATSDQKDEVSRIKGEFDAVGEQMRMMGCPIPVPAPQEPAKQIARSDPPTAVVRTRDWSRSSSCTDGDRAAGQAACDVVPAR